MLGRNSVAGILLISLVLSMPAVISGCSGSSRNQGEQLKATQEKMKEEKESEKLKKLEEKIESLFETLGGPAMKTESSKKPEDMKHDQHGQEESQKEKKQQENPQQEGGQKESGQQEDNQQKSGQESGRNESQKHGGQMDDKQKENGKWKEVDKIINSLHYQWNDLMPEITKKGADMKLADAFAGSLNSLTTEADSRDRDKVLASANRLYSHIPDLFSLYRLKMSPELKRMVYYTRNIILESEKDNWEQVGKDRESLEKSWSLLRNTLEEGQKKTGDKLDLSIYELKKVVSEKNRQLAVIKGRIVLNNLSELSESFEKSK
ncbi:MAG TPA: hypothetical protein PK127_04800 [Clostridiales bacterium]|nr:hypothetical protein [Clostridiales bacterium]HPV01775.1 hypothetical protein [Clostridiales bacterium]